MKGLVDWLDDRASIRAAWRAVMEHPVLGGARPQYVFGTVMMFLFLMQVVVGVLLASYYSPSATDAWASTAYIQDRVTMGWFLRGLHYHGASLMVVLTILHFCRVVLAGAYKRPRELTWLTGIVLGAVVLGFALTGYPLPWDQNAYWSSQVRFGIAGSVPGGDVVTTLAQGGSEHGNLTLLRYYVLHVFVLPLCVLLLLPAHVLLVRKHGPTTPPAMTDDERRAKAVPYWPNQMFLDIVAMTIVGSVVVAMTLRTHGAELYAPAQPASTFEARPEWFFYFLNQLLKYFQGPVQIIGTVMIPGAVTAFLVALPWVDRASSRSWRARKGVLAAVALLLVGATILSAQVVIADANNEDFQDARAEQQAEARWARALAAKGVLPEGGDAVYQNDPQVKARTLFGDHCETCHAVDGIGGEEAPDLTDYGSRAWLSDLVRNPSAPRFFAETPHDEMDPYPEEDLSAADLAAAVEFVISLRGDEPFDAELAKRGRAVFDDEQDCSTCHELEPGLDGDGPNLNGHAGPAWVARVIRDSSAPDLYGRAADMPKFAEKLDADEIALLVRFVVGQRDGGDDAGADAAAPPAPAGVSE